MSDLNLTATDTRVQASRNKKNSTMTDVNYNMNAPMKWSEFTNMSLDLQDSYCSDLINNYGVPLKAISAVFGISQSYFSKYVRENHLENTSSANKNNRHRKVPNEHLEDWLAFINRGMESDTFDSEKSEQPMVQTESPTVREPQKTSVANFNVKYVGDIYLADITKYINILLGDKFNGSLEITFTRNEQ